jgi:hypothetical protein
MIDIDKYKLYLNALRSKFQDFSCCLEDSGEDIVSQTILETPFYPEPQPTEIFATLPNNM